MPLRAEILEQHEVLSRLLVSQEAAVKEIAHQIRKLDVDYVFLAARGTSDNAGLYAKYLWGAFNKLPIALATPSLFTLYEHPPSLRGSLVVGISQSGQAPDIVGGLALTDVNTPAISDHPRVFYGGRVQIGKAAAGGSPDSTSRSSS